MTARTSEFFVQGTEPTGSCTDPAPPPMLRSDSLAGLRARADTTNPFRIPPS